MLSLSSCFFTGRLFSTDGQTANKRFEQILKAIQDKDKSALKGLFCKQALADAKDIDESITNLFDFFQGEVVSCDDWGGPGVDELREYGQRTKEVRSTYDVETSEQKYRFAIKEFTVDTIHPENVGVYSLYIINAKDTDEKFAYGGDGNWTPGIIVAQPS